VSAITVPIPATHRTNVSRVSAPGEIEGFEGEVTARRFRYRDADAGWAVLQATGADGDDLILVGPLSHLREGERARVTGSWVDDPRYGVQVKVAQADPLDPADPESLAVFLRSVKHVGPKRADRLIATFGAPDTLRAIDDDPHRALAAAGLPSRALAEAAASWEELRAQRNLHLLLAPHSLVYLTGRLVQAYGDGAARVVRDRPYELTSVFGVGFSTADRIARGLGCPPEDPERARAGALHVLAEAERGGSTCLPAQGLISEMADLLDMEVTGAVIDRLVRGGELVQEGPWVYRRQTAELERELAERVTDLLKLGPADKLKNARAVQPETGDALTEEQLAGVQSALRHRLSLITGGPGTGKTASIKAIAQAATRHGAHVLLAAPTGRAAVRMSEASGLRAQTVHSALGWVPGEGPIHDEEDPLLCDLLIVDESSMANLELMVTLLRAVGPETHVVLVGDADQLAPVGAGKPFAELVATPSVPTAHLSHIFRQAAGSMIVQGAHAIRRGQVPGFSPRPEMRRDLFLVARPDARSALQEVISLVCRRLPAHFDVDPVRDIQVFAPVYRGELGIDALNQALRDELNPDGRAVTGGRLRIGDKVMLTGRNLHDLGLMNGTVLRLEDEVAGDEDRSEAALILSAEEAVFRVPAEQADRLRLGYACSVHRGQGIELPVAVIVAHPAGGSFFMRREMLYTAVTRARVATVIVGTAQAVARAARTPDTGRRHSRLAERLQETQAPDCAPGVSADSPSAGSSSGRATRGSSGAATWASSAIASATVPRDEIRS
jgi:exodeoxyribonuclease V alpha subunit